MPMGKSTIEIEEQARPTSPAAEAPERPIYQAMPGFWGVCSFTLFFGVSYSVIAGSPIYLMVRHWGASETMIGFLLSIMPATQIVRIFIAPYMDRVNFKRYILCGALLRSCFYIGLAAMPFLVHREAVGPGAALYLLMLFIIGVDFSHGISMVPWITWLSRLIPEKLRGRYFSIESIMGNIGIISLSYVAGVIIGAQKNDFRFGIYLAVGAAASWLSMYCLSRIPSVPVIKSAPDGKRVNPFDLRWIPDLLRITPFRRMLYVVILNGLGLSMGAFGILFATEDLHQRQDILMKLLALSTIGSLLAVYIWGSLSDRFGSRPVMTLAYRLVLLSIIPGFLITLFMPMNLIFLYTVGTIAGFIGTVGMVGYSINGYRYLLGCIPKEKMVQGSVLYMLILQLASGIGPPVWGSLLKLGQNLNIVIGPFHIHRYTCLNFAMLLMVFVTLRMMRRLENRESDATPNDVLIYAIRHTPQTIRSIVSGAGQKLSKSVKPQPEK